MNRKLAINLKAHAKSHMNPASLKRKEILLDASQGQKNRNKVGIGRVDLKLSKGLYLLRLTEKSSETNAARPLVD